MSKHNSSCIVPYQTHDTTLAYNKRINELITSYKKPTKSSPTPGNSAKARRGSFMLQSEEFDVQHIQTLSEKKMIVELDNYNNDDSNPKPSSR